LGIQAGPPWLVQQDGRLRSLWRLVLFVLVFLVLFWLQARVLVAVFPIRLSPDQLLELLVVQGVLMLTSALLAGWALLRWVDRRPLRSLGFGLDRHVPRDLAVGIGFGAVALVVVVGLLALAGAYQYARAPGSATEWLAVMGAALLWLVIPATAEEAVFRGYPFRTLVEGIGPVGAILVMNVLFAWVHGQNPEVGTFGYINIFLAGVMLSVAMLWTGSLWFASALHLGWNWATAALLDLPVSGLRLFEAPLYRGEPVGPDWVTGGAFGPEGGLAGSLAVVAVLALIWWYAPPGSRGRDTGGGEEPQVDG
jgi:uncharacterized protein